MQYVTLLRQRVELFSGADFAAHLRAERDAVCELYEAGIVRQVWRRGDLPGTCLLIEAQTESEARNALEMLPHVRSGSVELTSIVPLMPYGGFSAPRPARAPASFAA